VASTRLDESRPRSSLWHAASDFQPLAIDPARQERASLFFLPQVFARLVTVSGIGKPIVSDPRRGVSADVGKRVIYRCGQNSIWCG